MPHSALQGLNIIHPIDPQLDQQQQYDLSNTSSLPDLDARLELWTNLAFQSDEPFIPRPSSPSSAHYDKHLDSTLFHSQPTHPNFDMSRIFAGFGLDPFLIPPTNSSVVDPNDISSFLPSTPEPVLKSIHTLDSISTAKSRTSDHPAPAAKRARTRTSSTEPYAASPDESRTLTQTMITDSEYNEGGASPDASSQPTSTSPLNATEDKRRRNTAASARFRAKKKEREVALEKKSKELESRVGELERECEALRRENGWLKELVVGGAMRGRSDDKQASNTKVKEDLKA